jgi:hypothetical protein
MRHRVDTEKNQFRHTTYAISASDILPVHICLIAAEKKSTNLPAKLAPFTLVAQPQAEYSSPTHTRFSATDAQI